MMRMLNPHRISSGVRALFSHLETPLVGSRKTGMEWVFFIGAHRWDLRVLHKIDET